MAQIEKIIKKYPNRRLYDTNESQYTSLEAIKQLVIQGVLFKVIDAKSEKDLTHQILLQILAEEESKGSPLLTTELLQLLIRFYGNPLQGMIGHYLEQSLFFLISQQKVLKTTLSQWIKPALSELPENLKFWKYFEGFSNKPKPTSARKKTRKKEKTGK